MNQGLIPQRYARALYKVAVERNCQEPLYSLMTTLEAGFAANPDLDRTIGNPFIDDSVKNQLLLTAAGVEKGDDSVAVTTFVDFVKLLERNKRIAFMRAIALAYVAAYRRDRNISTVTITSASPLDPEARRRLKEMIAAHIPQGGSMEYNENVDPDLIGGFTIAIDNTRLDASIKNELKQLRLKLLSN